MSRKLKPIGPITNVVPRLTIKAREGRAPLTIDDLDIRLDGEPIKGLRGLSLHFSPDDITEARLDLGVAAVEVDMHVVRWLEAEAKKGEESS